jgi:hypothetical protein
MQSNAELIIFSLELVCRSCLRCCFPNNAIEPTTDLTASLSGVWRQRRERDRHRRNRVRRRKRGYFRVSARNRRRVDHRVLQGRQETRMPVSAFLRFLGVVHRMCVSDSRPSRGIVVF